MTYRYLRSRLVHSASRTPSSLWKRKKTIFRPLQVPSKINLRVFEESIDGKLASHTAQILDLVQENGFRSSDDDPPRDSANHGLGRRGRPRSPSPTLTFGATGTTQDIQSEFQCLKDSLAKQKLPSKIEKVPRGIRGEKSSKDMASSRNLVSTIGALASPKMGDGTRCPEG